MYMPQDQIRFLLGIAISVPLSLILRYISSYTYRKIFSLLLGTILQLYVYQKEIWIPLITHCMIYTILKRVPRKYGGHLITILSITLLLTYNIYRLIVAYDSWNLGISTLLMMCVCRYSMFAYAYQDGSVQIAQLKQQSQQLNRFQQLPSLFDFIGYCQFLPTCIIVTAIQYRTYDAYLRKVNHFAHIPLRPSVLKAIYDLGIAAFCAVFYVMGIIYFPLQTMTTKQFANSNMLYISYYSYFCITLIRFKYHLGWKISQLPVHISGLSYEPIKQAENKQVKQKKGEAKSQLDDFNGVQAVNPWQVQTTLHLRHKIANWNMSVQEWLRKCVYERLTTSKSTSQLITFVVSAIWHGCYGGYYISFIFWFLHVHLAGLVFKFSQQKERTLVKFYHQSKGIGFALLWFISNWAFSHNGLYFHVLSLTQSINILTTMYFLIPIANIIAILVFTLILGKTKSKNNRVEKQVTKKQQ